MSQTDDKDDFELSGDDFKDEDIDLLNRIVHRAAAQDGVFGVVLFTAYEEIIAEENVEDSSRFFLFLVRMVKVGVKEGQSPLDCFEAVLAELGINLLPEETEEVQAGRQDGQQEQQHQLGNGHGQTESETEQDAAVHNGHFVALNGNGITRPATEQQHRNTTNGLGVASRQLSHNRARSHDSEIRRQLAASQDRGRLTGRSASQELIGQQPSIFDRSASLGSDYSLASKSDRSFLDPGDEYAADESGALNETTQPRPPSISFGSSPFLPLALTQQPMEVMLEQAEAFLQTKTMIAVRRLLWQWRHKAVDAKREHARLQTIADDFEHETLLSGGFGVWRRIFLERKELEDTERDFTIMENNAVRERNLHIMHKAFTHWATVAREAQIRTGTARRHLLRHKHFNAWKETTVVNELKVRRFGLKKHFAIWRRRTSEIAEADYLATVTYESNLFKRYYWTWFWAYCGCVAPEMAQMKLMRRMFWKWVNIVRRRKEMELRADEFRAEKVAEALARAWAAASEKALNMETTANDFRYRKVNARFFGIWRRQAVLESRANQISLMVDQRVARTALSILNRHARLSQKAFEVDKYRLVRTAFTTWNEELRMRTLSDRIDGRVRAEAFYKWVLAERTVIQCEKHDTKIGMKWFDYWVEKTRTRRTTLEDAAQRFAAAQREKQLRATLLLWQERHQIRHEQETQATQLRNYRLLRPVMDEWRAQYAKIQMMEAKVEPARYWILTTSSLRVWKAATIEHQKIRRREAYYTVRRNHKMNMAREMLCRWQSRLAQSRAMEHAALEKVEDHSYRVTVSFLRNWQEKAQVFLQQGEQAESSHQQRLLGQTFSKLHARHSELQRLDQNAVSFAAGGVAVEAINCLRAMDRRLFQLRGQDQWAQNLREKHGEKHVKNMLHYWAERALASQQGRIKRGDRPSPEHLDNDDEDDEDDYGYNGDGRNPPPDGRQMSPRLKDFTAFDESALHLGDLDLDITGFQHDLLGGDFNTANLNTSTPLPGYLRTPSKRHTAKTAARERLTANVQFQLPPPTQAQTPYTGNITPFQRKLRAQGYTDRRTRTPKGSGTPGPPGRTPARRGFAGFENIIEVPGGEGSSNDGGWTGKR